MTQPQIAPALHEGSHLPPNYTLSNYNLATISFSELLQLKKALQDELYRLGQLLQSQGVDMDTPILTADGYPRSDIDIVAIRHLRARIILLRNDFDSVMNHLDRAMAEHFRGADNTSSVTAAAADLSVSDSSDNTSNNTLQPFIVVEDVLPLSPAFQADLQIHDKIIQFHNLTYNNTKDVLGRNGKVIEVAKLVKEYQNREVILKVLRYDSSSQQYLTLEKKLTPHSNWSGLGLLGCKLVQL